MELVRSMVQKLRTPKPLKVKYHILIIALILLVPILAGFQYYAKWFTGQIYSYVASQTSAALDVYLTAMKDQLISADQFLHMGEWGQPLEPDGYQGELLDMSRELLDHNNVISCVIFCGGPMALKECHMSSEGSLSSENVQALLEIAGREDAGDVGWALVWANDKPFLTRRLWQNGTACMVAVNMEAVGTKALSEYSMNSVVLFLKNGVPINSAYWARAYTKEDVKQHDGYYLLRRGSNSHIVVTSRLLDMTAVYASQNTITNFALMSTVIYAAVIVIAFMICGAVIRYNVLVPLHRLEKVMEQIRDGDLQARPGRFVTAEFVSVNETFNQMINSIEQLKIEKYEQQMLNKQLEMDALRLQIRPHFYLNCLKNLYGLSQMEQYELIQKNILYLSNHLRFTFEFKRDKVALREELAICENYINLQGIGQAMPPELALSVDASLTELAVPPVSILTLTENCFKHACCADMPMRISITVQQYVLEDSRIVSIRVADNGPGFDPDLLATLNKNFDELLTVSHTGLRNVVRRFQLMYGDSFSVAFFNCEGAVIEITLQQGGAPLEAADR